MKSEDRQPAIAKARQIAPPHTEFDNRYQITGADYRNVFGHLLWEERPYPFKALFGPGDSFIENYVEYRVHRVSIGPGGIIQYNVVCIS